MHLVDSKPMSIQLYLAHEMHMQVEDYWTLYYWSGIRTTHRGFGRTTFVNRFDTPPHPRHSYRTPSHLYCHIYCN